MNRIFPISLLALLTAVLPLTAFSQSCTTATCNATGPSESAVLAALPSSSNTNATVVVNIPSGTAAWTTPASYTVPSTVTNLTIQGTTTVNCTGTPGTSGYSCSATDGTIIQDDNSNQSNSTWIIITGGDSSYFRLTGITIEPHDSSIPTKNNGVINIDGTSKNFRWDHSHIVLDPNDNAGVVFTGQIEGVLDHNVLNGGDQGTFPQLIRVDNDLLDTVGNGDGGWMSPTDFGSQHFLFEEDNYFDGGYTGDCADAGRVVIRYNTFYNMQLASGAVHSTKDYAGPFRGCRAMEFYHNYMSGSSVVYTATGGEGSTTLNWGNTLGNLSNYWYYSGGLYRNDEGVNGEPSNASPPNGWGYCGTTVASSFSTPGTGASSWDGNSNTATGYPCLDGLGRGQQQDAMNGAGFPSRANTTHGGQTWPHQYLEPMYFFDNTLPSGMSGEVLITDESTQFNRDVYFGCNSYNSACSGGFTGAAGTGYGPLSSRPSTCTPGPGGTYGTSPTGSYGVAYWATDANGGNGELYVCTATNTWTGIYQPYAYPHPLDGGTSSGKSTLGVPTALTGSVN